MNSKLSWTVVPSGEGVLANSLQALSEGNSLTSFLPSEPQGGEGNSLNPENPINQIIKLMSRTKKNFDISDVVSKLRNKKSRKDK